MAITGHSRAMCAASSSGPFASVPDDADDLARRFEAVQGELRRFILRQIPDPSETEDILQEVFLRLLKRGGLDGIERFDAYAMETAKGAIRDRHRRRTVREAGNHVPLNPEVHLAPAVPVDEALASREALQAATAALWELPERTRAIFVLRRLEGLAYREIAQRFGITVSAVEKQMLRATQHLLLRAEGFR